MTTVVSEASVRPTSRFRPWSANIVRSALHHPLFSYRVVVTTSGLLLFLGLMMVMSSSSVIAAVDMEDPYYFVKKQIIFAGLGVVAAWILSRLSEKLISKSAWPVFLIAVLLLTMTISPLGVSVSGNQNWLSFGPAWTQFQPSEFAKVAIIVWGANDLARRGKYLRDLRQWLVFVFGAMSLTALVVFQKDQGTAMVFLAIMILILIAAGAPLRLLFSLIVTVGVGVVALIVYQPYRMARFWAFFNPEEDPMGLNLQSRRGVYALASGGWFGQGLGSSRQKWGLLAESHTDFVFAIIGEELGLVGTITVIGLFVVLALVGIRIATRSVSTFSRLIAVGVIAWLTVQAFVNIAVAIRLVPVMGITLPMISYGGSSLLANLAAIGLLAGCARREPEAAALLATRRHQPRWRTIVRTQS